MIKLLSVLFLSCVLVGFTLAQTNCSTNEDCQAGYKCKEFVECNDFGCSTPVYQCWPSDDGPTRLSARQENHTEAPEESKVQTKTKTETKTGQEPATPPAPENNQIPAANGPSRLIVRTRNSEESILRFDSANNDFAYSFSMDPTHREFNLHAGDKQVMRFNADGTEIDCTNDVMLRTDGLEVQNIWTFEDSQLKYNGVPQWKLVHDEVFRVGEMAQGWNLPDSVTKCGAIHMLGGYCTTSNENLVKVFDNLPHHTRIKIEANFHFLDSWGGETAFLRVSETEDLGTLNYAWTDSHDYIASRNAVNVCGRDIGDGKFNSLISFEMIHSHSALKVMFGSSLEQKACAASYGVSSFRIYII